MLYSSLFMPSPKIQPLIKQLRDTFRAKQIQIESEKEIDYGHQFKLIRGADVATVNLYTTGKTLVQGKASDLKTELDSLTPSRQPAAEVESNGKARIGMDESGKGDYFGSLVIAAAYVDAATESKLLRLGVRDSKMIDDHRILELENDIKILCPHSVIEIAPPRYNTLYAELKNLNKVLAQGHAQALENVLGKVSCQLAIVDQFGNEKYVTEALLEKGKRIKVEQRTKGERDMAVAAASILARARFVQSIESLSQFVGRELPKGASDPSINLIRESIIKQQGQEMLSKIAKVHFNM